MWEALKSVKWAWEHVTKITPLLDYLTISDTAQVFIVLVVGLWGTMLLALLCRKRG
jgi:hypothetical protein